MKNTEQLTPSSYYHIYNRGVNRMTIFAKQSNYAYFLKKYLEYIGPMADTYAYCLLPNHFHLLIRTKDEEEIHEALSHKVPVDKLVQNISKQISLQFSHFFNGYTQAFNKQQGRSGKLFELPFRRIKVTEASYFSRLVFYIHTNPQKHGLINDFRQWKHASYQNLLSNQPTILKRKEVLDWFGGREAYVKFHTDLRDVDPVHHLLLDA